MLNDAVSHNLHTQNLYPKTKKQKTPLFTVIESLCDTEGAEGIRVYGIEMKFGDTIVIQNDISAEYENTLYLLHMLEENGDLLSTEHFFEICEDFVESCAGGAYR